MLLTMVTTVKVTAKPVGTEQHTVLNKWHTLHTVKPTPITERITLARRGPRS